VLVQTLPDFKPVRGAVTCISVSLLRIKTAFIPFPVKKNATQTKLNSILNMPQIKYKRVQQILVSFFLKIKKKLFRFLNLIDAFFELSFAKKCFKKIQNEKIKR